MTWYFLPEELKMLKRIFFLELIILFLKNNSYLYIFYLSGNFIFIYICIYLKKSPDNHENFTRFCSSLHFQILYLPSSVAKWLSVLTEIRKITNSDIPWIILDPNADGVLYILFKISLNTTYWHKKVISY